MKPAPIALPQGIIAADLKYPDYKQHDKDPHLYDHDFEIWYTERFGWVIPTLTIRNLGYRAQTRHPRIDAGNATRSYAIAISNGGMCRVGLGPHIKAKHSVYVRKSTADRLKPFTDLREQGSGKANDIRDRISTRRLRGYSSIASILDMMGGSR
jgi:hypothetical protein